LHIGIDIGGSRVKVAWRTAPGSHPSWCIVDAMPLDDPRGWFDRLLPLLPTRARRAIDSARLQGVGIAVPGEVRDPGILVQSPNLPRWRKLAIGPDLSRTLGVPVHVENDANMAAVGLLSRPALTSGRLRNVLVVTLGTGVGAGWILDGRLFRRPPGGEAEIGHCPVAPGGPRCACGRAGCLEALAGGRALVARASQAGLPVPDAAALAAAAERGDAVAVRLFAEAGDALGRSCAWVTNLNATSKFVFVGGVARARNLILPSLRTAYREAVFASHARRAYFRFPAIRDVLGVLGALHAAESHGDYRMYASDLA
jgi:glucokinase